VHLKPLSVSVFAYLPYTKEEQSIIEKRKAEKIRIKKEEEQKKLMISDAKVKIREDLKSELEKKIAEAEAKIASGSEYKSTKKKK
jgi:1,4-alpha-glucan branching enzyme